MCVGHGAHHLHVRAEMCACTRRKTLFHFYIQFENDPHGDYYAETHINETQSV